MVNILIADGDSITTGFGVTTPYTGLLSLTKSWNITNIGISGELLSQMLSNAPSAVNPRFKAGSGNRNVVLIWGGTNDIAVNGVAPATVYSTYQSYCAEIHSAGGLCYPVTMLSRVGFDTQKNTFNNLLIANHAWADGLVDFTGTVLGVDNGWSNTTYFQADGIHPNQNGVTTIEAPAFNAIVNAIP